MVTLVNFEINEGLRTSDNFFLKLKGQILPTKEVYQTNLINSVSKVCQSYFQKMTLLEALDLINDNNVMNLKDQISDQSNVEIKSFKIITVDAYEIETKEEIQINIDPSLETQKLSKGVFRKIKSIFKK